MRITVTVTVDEPTGDFQDRLLALLAEHSAHVETDTEWTAERAERYYLALPPRAKRIIKAAAAFDGYVSADVLRDRPSDSLRGHSAALTLGLERGVRKGLWPDGMQVPVEPESRGFGKVEGYRMPADLVPVFKQVVLNNPAQRSVLETAIRKDHGVWDTARGMQVLQDAGHDPSEKWVREIYRRLATEGVLEKIDPAAAVYRRTGQ